MPSRSPKNRRPSTPIFAGVSSFLGRRLAGFEEDLAASTTAARRALKLGRAEDIAAAFERNPLTGFLGAGTIRGTKIIAPAVRIGGRTFSGVEHGEAFAKARKVFGNERVKDLIDDRSIQGFLTDTGEFVRRSDATMLAIDDIARSDPKLAGALIKELQKGRPVGVTANMLPKILREKGSQKAIERGFAE